MKYPYSVKANGKWYRPNENVPDAPVQEAESTNQRDIPQVEEVQTANAAVEDEPKRRGRKSTK